VNFSLSQSNFEDLVKGKIVELPTPGGDIIKIALQDIGHLNMLMDVVSSVLVTEDYDAALKYLDTIADGIREQHSIPERHEVIHTDVSPCGEFRVCVWAVGYSKGFKALKIADVEAGMTCTVLKEELYDERENAIQRCHGWITGED
jgi:hypothetical protein